MRKVSQPIKKKKIDVLNIAAELYAIWKNEERSKKFESWLSSLYCQEPWLCWKSITEFLDWIRNDTLEGTEKRNDAFIGIVHQFINEKGEYTLNLTQKNLKTNLLEASKKLSNGDDDAFDITLLFNLQAATEILIAYNLKIFLLEFPYDEENDMKKKKKDKIIEYVMDVQITSLQEIQHSKVKRVTKKRNCILNITKETLNIERVNSRKEQKAKNILSLRFVQLITETKNKKSKVFQLQHMTRTSQLIFFFKAPSHSVKEKYIEEFMKIRQRYDERLSKISDATKQILKQPIVHPDKQLLEFVSKEIFKKTSIVRFPTFEKLERTSVSSNPMAPIKEVDEEEDSAEIKLNESSKKLNFSGAFDFGDGKSSTDENPKNDSMKLDYSMVKPSSMYGVAVKKIILILIYFYIFNF